MNNSHCRNVQSHDVEMSQLPVQLGSPLWTLVYVRVDSSLVLSHINLNLFRAKVGLYASTAL